jgi:hypothetical protein
MTHIQISVTRSSIARNWEEGCSQSESALTDCSGIEYFSTTI